MDISSLDIPVDTNHPLVSIKDATGMSYKFTTSSEFISFLREEASYWHTLSNSVDSNKLINTQYETDPDNNSNYIELDLFDKTILNGLYFKNLLHNLNKNTLEKSIYEANNKHLNVIKKQLIVDIEEYINSVKFENWICSKSPIWKRALEISQSLSTNTADYFLKALIDSSNTVEINNFNALKGYLLAFEFQIQDKNLLKNRLDFEKDSIADLKTRILNIKSEIYEYNEEYNSKINHQYEEWQDKINNLEDTYREKLRLEPAANYWKKKANEYKKLGNCWATILSGILFIGIIGFGILFHAWLQSQSVPISIDSLQGVVLFITVLSIYAFAIKAISKMVFSSYHLQRDAEEREQLTYLYLSLTHENESFDSDARNIVLQSLFSRVDSGLISGDSSPTMPGLHEIIKASSSKN